MQNKKSDNSNYQESWCIPDLIDQWEMSWAPPYCPRFHLWEVLLVKRLASFHQKDGCSEPLSSTADDQSQNLNKLIYNYNNKEDKKTCIYLKYAAALLDELINV